MAVIRLLQVGMRSSQYRHGAIAMMDSTVELITTPSHFRSGAPSCPKSRCEALS
jgi:hypothetical protein